MPNSYWHDTVCSTVQWIARCTHLGSINIKSEDSILLKKSVAYSHHVFKEKAGLHMEKV